MFIRNLVGGWERVVVVVLPAAKRGMTYAGNGFNWLSTVFDALFSGLKGYDCLA